MCPKSLFAQLIGTVDEEDAVLHDDTHQGQQTDLGKETHLLPGRPHGKKRPRKGQRRGQHDQQGLSKAIELAGEHYVERDQSEDKGGYDCRRRVAQSARHALFLDSHSGRRREVRDDLVGARVRIAQRGSGWEIEDDGDLTRTVEPVDLRRPGFHADVCD